MRPGQQNRRMRGRNNNSNNSSNNSSSNNNNNRRGPNPLTRSYESNGPDVKIRGSAQQIAEKYTTLARDAQSSGDRVIAENYLQHAEHYNRIIAAAQAQVAAQQVRDPRDEIDEDGEEDQRGDGMAGNGGRENHQHYTNDGSGPQPVIEGTPAEVAYNRNNEGAHAQPSNNSSDNSHGGSGNSHGQGEQMNGNRVEAAPAQAQAPAEEEGAPRRARRPRRKPIARVEEEGQASGVQPVEAKAVAAAEPPSAESGGTLEKAE